MARNFHLFITPKYFQKCVEWGLYGVGERGTKWGVNQIANVHQGDVAFFYTTQKIGARSRGLVYGPFEIISEPFFNEEVVWEQLPGGGDLFPYRVKLKPAEGRAWDRPIPIQRIWDLREEGKLRTILDVSSLSERSIINLFRDEGLLILESLLQLNADSSGGPTPCLGHNLVETPIDCFQTAWLRGHSFRREHFLEYYLLRYPQAIHRLVGLPEPGPEIEVEIYNQVGTYIAGGAIDIVCVYRKRMFDAWLAMAVAVLELKNEPLEEEVVDQMVEYVEWAHRLFPRCRREMVRGVLVGAQNQSPRRASPRARLGRRLSALGSVYNLKAFEYDVNAAAQKVNFAKVVLE